MESPTLVARVRQCLHRWRRPAGRKALCVCLSIREYLRAGAHLRLVNISCTRACPHACVCTRGMLQAQVPTAPAGWHWAVVALAKVVVGYGTVITVDIVAKKLAVAAVAAVIGVNTQVPFKVPMGGGEGVAVREGCGIFPAAHALCAFAVAGLVCMGAGMCVLGWGCP
jgi:hypothetical protein